MMARDLGVLPWPREWTGKLATHLDSLSGAQLLLEAAVIRVCLAVCLHAVPTHDCFRFVQQAQDLIAGHGYVHYGRPEVSLPPGYPFFLACLIGVGVPVDEIWLIQIALGAASAALLFEALRPFALGPASWSFLLLAAHPWLVAIGKIPMSETLTMFLATLFLHEVSRILLRPGALQWATAAVISVAMVLTGPATIFLAGGVWLALLWRFRRQPNLTVVGVMVALLALVPWEVHCFRATGRVQWTILSTSGSVFETPSFLWFRTWMRSPSDLLVLWDSTGQLLSGRPHAFTSTVERETVMRWYATCRNGEISVQELAERLNRLGATRRQAEPASFYLIKPALRAVSLWVLLPPLTTAWGDTLERLAIWEAAPWRVAAEAKARGVLSGLHALLKGLLSLLWLGIHCGILLLGVLACGRAMRTSSAMPLAIAFSVVGYTAFYGFRGVGESRRNLPYLPALFLACAITQRKESLDTPVTARAWGQAGR